MDFKNKIIDALEKLRQKETADKQPFKARAYKIVIQNLKNHDKPILVIEDIDEIKGIGKGIRERIIEIIETNELKQLETFDVALKIKTELANIHGIGPVKAKELVEMHNIKSIEDLEAHPELLNEKQKIGLKYYRDFMKRIPRPEMIKHDAFIEDIMKKLDIEYQIVGSYRRGMPDSGDIDVIVYHPTLTIRDIVAKFRQTKYLAADFALGDHKYLGVCRLPRHRSYRRIDILYASREVWPYSLLYFTGSAEFNVALRNAALSQHYSLNEYGLTPTTSVPAPPALRTEEEVLNFLGYKYIEPSKRTAKLQLSDYKIR